MTGPKTPAAGGAEAPAAGPAAHGANAAGRGGAARVGETAGGGGRSPANPQTRLLRGLRPLQSSPRPSAAGLRYSLGRRLTDRDREIAVAVHRHRVLSATHISALFFSSHKRALVRLKTLTDLGVLDRFQVLARRGEPNQYHYVLGREGAAIVAAERGEDPEAAVCRWRGDSALVLARGQRLAHTLGVSGFYAAVAAEGRRGAGRLAHWLTEAEAARWSDSCVHPDGLGVWAEAGREVEFFLEYDRGTETLGRLKSKLDAYRRFEEERGAAAWVLFAFTAAGREAAARRALEGADVAVATAVVRGGAPPTDAVWLPLSTPGPRLRLIALASEPVPAAAAARASAGAPRAWRYRSRPDDPEEAPIDRL